MMFIILFLFVGNLSNSHGGTQNSLQSPIDKNLLDWIKIDKFISIKNNLMESFANGKKNFIQSETEQLELLENAELGQSNCLVWKGIYTNNEKNIANKLVAVKIFTTLERFNMDFDIINALNATNDPNIEQHRIPRVYYHGPILDDYYGIAMTMFDGTLQEYYRKNEANLSRTAILSLFRHAIVGLKYLNSKNVVHNDINPRNLFVRGRKLFISDFDSSTLNGAQNELCTPVFATARFYRKQPRLPMDDLESLVYSIWWISNVPMIRYADSEETEGSILSKCTKEEAKVRVLEKLKHYKDKQVREVMEFICVDEMLSERSVPCYDTIITKLTEAM